MKQRWQFIRRDITYAATTTKHAYLAWRDVIADLLLMAHR